MNINNNLYIDKKPQSYLKTVLAACFGTFLEWYDFLTFGALAVTFGPLFFPSNDPSASLLPSLATFGVGMIVRPIGAAFFGSLGDRIGRKPVFMITISIMGLATLLVGFLPIYSEIGIWAPILLVSLRILQGFSAGGEIGGGAIFLAEHAGEKNRGFKTSFLQLMGPFGILASTLQITFLQQWLSPEEFQAWGWRIPFFISFLLLLLAIYFRKTLEETPIFEELKTKDLKTEGQLLNNFKDSEIRKRMFLLFFCVSGAGAILFFCAQIYLPIFLKTTVRLSAELVDQLSVLSTLFLVLSIIFAGWLSDQVGRKPIITCGLALGALLILPAFWMIETIGSHLPLTQQDINIIGCIMLGLSLILGLLGGPQAAILTELFPAKSRSSAATFPHNLAAGWIGGMLPFIVAWINHRLTSQVGGLYYPAILLLLACVIAFFWLPETNKEKLEK
ncbi:MFS transporter [Polynucleobacter paludilacus]|uniref:MFS transporter n=1 Tax=Polynucleobacter paludilacus TaxID=1855895 RepID=UPI001BFCF765|nr:MFS transporter [Polynucleobacter paludilacus]QWD87134.1 MFS transporter [Polynucleobacter paludilacus]